MNIKFTENKSQLLGKNVLMARGQFMDLARHDTFEVLKNHLSSSGQWIADLNLGYKKTAICFIEIGLKTKERAVASLSAYVDETVAISVFCESRNLAKRFFFNLFKELDIVPSERALPMKGYEEFDQQFAEIVKKAWLN